MCRYFGLEEYYSELYGQAIQHLKFPRLYMPGHDCGQP
jgi:hypothetical protein